MVGLNAQERLARIEKVRTYMAYGLTDSEIAEKLNVHINTIKKDRRAIAAGIFNDLKKEPIEKTIAHATLQQKEAIRRAWKQYMDDSTPPSVKASLLRTIIESSNHEVELMIKLGFIPSPDKLIINAGNTVNTQVNMYDQDHLKLVTDIIRDKFDVEKLKKAIMSEDEKKPQNSTKDINSSN